VNPFEALLTESREWMEDAACRGKGPDRWFPAQRGETRRGAGRRAFAKARAVCALCPVRVDCLAYAEKLGEEHGMWGGLTPDERHQRRKDRDAGLFVDPAPEIAGLTPPQRRPRTPSR
jgi:WhiB family redox-sensing transcriptional regulator